ncbi:hypothetical protein [Terrisporobacter petrolearius]|uniref:hypothetical protein n=1 Tax=Terrisporobacter petrolearius TaxID=1460447 RepID=UPI0031CC4636
MPRVYLTLEQELFERIEEDAKNNNITMNLLIQNIFERIYMSGLTYTEIIEKIGLDTVRFDYTIALNKLIEEVESRPDGEFTLADLESFSKLCISTSENGYLQPATLRARLGKIFNSAVRKNTYNNQIVPFVKRAKKENGELKFLARAAVYVKDSSIQNDSEF